MGTRVLEKILRAEHHRGFVSSRRGQRRQATRHGIEHLPIRRRLRLRAIRDAVPHATPNQDHVACTESNVPTIARRAQPADAALNDMHMRLRDGIDLDPPWRHELGLRHHGRSHACDRKYVREHVPCDCADRIREYPGRRPPERRERPSSPLPARSTRGANAAGGPCRRATPSPESLRARRHARVAAALARCDRALRLVPLACRSGTELARSRARRTLA